MKTAKRLAQGFIYIFSILVIANIAGMVPVYAMSECQRLAIDSNARYYNCEVTKFVSSCGTGSTDLTGGDNDEKIWNYLIGKGLTAIQAAGIMGNFQAESGFDPTIVQGGGHSDTITVDGVTGYGIAQWTYITRQQALLDFATQGGKPATNSSDLLTQLDFMYMESTTGSLAGSWDRLKEQENIPDATVSWHNNYESSADTAEMIQNRVNFAEENFAKFSSSGGTTTSPPGSKSCGSGSGQNVKGFSLPVARTIYDEHPDWFPDKHHDYPAIDIQVGEGTKVYAMSAGTVSIVAEGGDCGTGLVIDHGNNFQTKYCHGKAGGIPSSIKDGSKVTVGQEIMISGNTGRSSGPHLHVETIVGGTNRCPLPLINGIVAGSPPNPNELPSSGCISDV